jgi:hypothetical protein
VDVAAEIIKGIKKHCPYAKDGDLRKKVQENLKICFLRSPKGGKAYKDNKTIGLHSKCLDRGKRQKTTIILVLSASYCECRTTTFDSLLSVSSSLPLHHIKNKRTSAKHFIIDDVCCYIGSQNMYICDLAEWGVVIDDARRVQAIREEYWYVSYNRLSSFS